MLWLGAICEMPSMEMLCQLLHQNLNKTPIGTASCLEQTPPQSIPGPSPLGHPWRSSAAAERSTAVHRTVAATGENGDAETLMVYGMQ